MPFSEEFHFERFSLPNGVWLGCTRTKGPDCCIILLFRAGRAYDPEHLPGLSHLLEHMLLKGFPGMAESSIMNEFERLSGRNPFLSTTFEFIDFRLRFPAAAIREVLALVAGIFSGHSFQEADLDDEKRIIVTEIAGSEESPLSQFYRMLRKRIYGSQVYGEPVGGTTETVKSFTIEDIRKWASSVLRGPNLSVALAGGLPAQVLRDAVEESLGSLQGGSPIEPGQAYGVPIPGPPHERISASYQLPRFSRSMELYFSAPGIISPDFPLANLLFSYLDSGGASRLFRAFRQDNCLCYNFGISCESPRKCRGDHFSIYAIDYPAGTAPRVEQIILREIEALREGNIDEERLEMLKNNVLKRFYENWYERVQDRVLAIINERLSGMTMKDYYERILTLQAVDLTAFAEKYLGSAMTVELNSPGL